MQNMNHVKSGFALLFICTAALINVSSAFAIKWAESPMLAWEKKAIDLFDRDKFDKVISMVNDLEKDPNRNAPVFIYYCHAQKYYVNHDRDSAVYYKQQYRTMLNRLSVKNLPVLIRLASLPQMSWNKKINKRFIDSAFEKADSDEHLGSVLYYLIYDDTEIATSSLKGLSSILQKKRNIVMNGGKLSIKERAWMTNDMLIKKLIRMSGDAANPMTGLIKKAPAVARKKMMGNAPKCLALIEEPALQHLREAAALGDPNASATIVLVQDAIQERRAKYPGSKWYTAKP